MDHWRDKRILKAQLRQELNQKIWLKESKILKLNRT